MRRLTSVLTSAFVLLAMQAPRAAQAGLVSETYVFSGDTGGRLPGNAVGTINIVYDPALSYTNETTGLTVVSLNFTPSSPIGFTYYSIWSSRSMFIGGLANGAATADFTSGTDFSLAYDTGISQPAMGSFIFSVNGDWYGGTTNVSGLTVSVARNAVSVNEPPAASVLILALAALVAARRRQVPARG